MSEVLTVYVTSWDRLAHSKISNGRVVQVSREKPHHIEVDFKHHNAIPTRKLVDRYKDNLVDDDDFERRYSNHLSDREWLIIDGLRDGDNLVAWESPEEWCASSILAQWLSDRGIGVEIVLENPPLEGGVDTKRLFPSGKQE